MALLPQRMDSPRARVMMLAIPLQESNLADRRQGSASRPGPARGLSPFEVTGVRGVVNPVARHEVAPRVARARGRALNAEAIHPPMAPAEVLDSAFTLTLLCTHPH